MRRGSIGRRTVDGTINTAALEILAPAIGNGCLLRELGISLVAATASVFGVGRPAAKGTTPTTPVTNLQESGDPNSVRARTALAWGVGPTAPAQFYGRIALSGTIGAYYAFLWESGLYIPAGATIVLWNLAGNSVADVTLSVDEL